MEAVRATIQRPVDVGVITASAPVAPDRRHTIAARSGLYYSATTERRPGGPWVPYLTLDGRPWWNDLGSPPTLDCLVIHGPVLTATCSDNYC